MAEHYFFALALPHSIKEEIDSLSEDLKSTFPFKKWVAASDYHITLAFLGDAEKNNLDVAIGNIDKNLSGFEAFSLEVNQLGTFGQRIFWAGVKENNALLDLQARIYKACLDAHFALEKRTFHPHITLARKWEGKQKVNEEQLISYHPSLSFLANEVVLYKTHPDRTPKYEKVKKFFLQ